MNQKLINRLGKEEKHIIESVEVEIKRRGYGKYERCILHIYETLTATLAYNNITQKPLETILKKLGYVSKYVMTQHGIRQRLVNDEDWQHTQRNST